MNTNTGVKYAWITRRVIACMVDQMIFLPSIYSFCSYHHMSSLLNFNYISFDSDTASLLHQWGILETLLFIALEILMIIRLGWTQEKLLFGIYIKGVNTLENVVLTQVVTRSAFKGFLLLPSYIFSSGWFFVLPTLVFIFVIFDQHKQTFYA